MIKIKSLTDPLNLYTFQYEKDKNLKFKIKRLSYSNPNYETPPLLLHASERTVLNKQLKKSRPISTLCPHGPIGMQHLNLLISFFLFFWMIKNLLKKVNKNKKDPQETPQKQDGPKVIRSL